MSVATDMLAKYMQAELAILEGKEVQFENRKLRMEDLDSVRAGRKEWEAKVAAERARAAGRPTFGGAGYSVASFAGR
ncbi:hypothetical protein [Massilia endophytica]|uniref:hypothetical protein n=1 Tax=Massilia endophytica TaxID=2899220 RepID=UPI001E43515B|nr:hypothetical protein [Massilia endophytica]UGQ45088.1 hypothetical protein LSQ66_14940 [Massilia endophytica]